MGNNQGGESILKKPALALVLTQCYILALALALVLTPVLTLVLALVLALVLVRRGSDRGGG